METYAIEHLSFTYPGQNQPALRDINLRIPPGQLLLLCGYSGCGKSTLLRHCKSVLSPSGQRSGEVRFKGRELSTVSHREQASAIGLVLQNPDNQIVTDKVWHELAFGLESLGMSAPEIRLRVAEMATFFGIQEWFHRPVSELSGGQKQILNLSSVVAMQPEVLILDEPTSQLDPIATTDFWAMVQKINQELGVTVIIVEQRLEEIWSLSERVVVMESGRIIADGSPLQVGSALKRQGHGLFLSLPAPMRIHAGIENDLPCPLTVRAGRDFMDALAESINFQALPAPAERKSAPGAAAIELKEVWFRYAQHTPDVIKGLSLNIAEAEIYAVVGGNGTGKTTLLSLLSGLHRPYRGTIAVGGREWERIPKEKLFKRFLAVLPQHPQALLTYNTVEKDLQSALSDSALTLSERRSRMEEMAERCALSALLDRHPYDLSCGEQQRVALTKVLLREPRILLLDEPTKGMDAPFKQRFAGILQDLQRDGVTIVLVSHDIEFCAQYADRCALLFDGNIMAEGEPHRFFSGHSFYTTVANRMARQHIPTAITVQEVVAAGGGQDWVYPDAPNTSKPGPDTPTPFQPGDDGETFRTLPLPALLSASRRRSRSLGAAWLMILAAIPLTILFGLTCLEDRQYAIISLLVMLEASLPLMLWFERRKPQARELIVIAALCGLAVTGRLVFFMLPQCKPVLALIIIAGVGLGAETGFLVGAMTALVSNFFLGQGPWTPWQILAYGLIGLLAGSLFYRRMLPQSRFLLCLFGGLAALFIHGGLLNPASVLMFQAKPTAEMFILSYIQGLPFDLIHAAATVIFLSLIAQPMLEKLERVKRKLGWDQLPTTTTIT